MKNRQKTIFYQIINSIICRMQVKGENKTKF